MMPVVIHLEDDENLQKTVAGFLSAYRCRIEHFSDGAAAYHKIARNGRNITLAIMDVHVPSMMGNDVVNLLRRGGTQFGTVVVTSGTPETSNRIGAAMIAGASIFLRKPEDYTVEMFDRLAVWSGLEKI